jgi:hypothetical protein
MVSYQVHDRQKKKIKVRQKDGDNYGYYRRKNEKKRLWIIIEKA